MNVVEKALSYLGVPYVWGGNDYNGIDCSGLTQQSYKYVGIDIPRTAQEQYNSSTKINATDLKPGDLIFEGTSTDNITHVLMYVGDNQAIEAPSRNKKVRITDLSTRSKIVGYGTYRNGYNATLLGNTLLDGGIFGLFKNLFKFGNASDNLKEYGTQLASNVLQFLIILLLVIVACYFIFKAFN